eukprot:2501661-Amphidinium_carterae.1
MPDREPHAMERLGFCGVQSQLTLFSCSVNKFQHSKSRKTTSLRRTLDNPNLGPKRCQGVLIPTASSFHG